MTKEKQIGKTLTQVAVIAHPTRMKILLALFNSEVLKIGPEFKNKKVI